MISQDHLQTFDVKLITQSPVFIGSGKKYNKKEYVFNEDSKKVSIIDDSKLMRLLIRNDLIDRYENYILNKPYEYLGEFLKSCNVSQKELYSITLYEVDACDALEEGKSLSEIHEFMHDKKYMPYIPGSSLKGALRTAILMKMIIDNQGYKILDGNMKCKQIEADFLNTAGLNQYNTKDEVNSIMRWISISDSEPIDRKNMILAKKDDISVSGNKKTINIIRECVAPSVQINFKMTLDKQILKKINMQFIKDAILNYGNYYEKTYFNSFKPHNNTIKPSFASCLLLGGGSGYFGKNIVYPLMGKEKAVHYVSDFMKVKFRNHFHDKDVRLGISPHMMKYTTYHSKGFHFGICRVEIN